VTLQVYVINAMSASRSPWDLLSYTSGHQPFGRAICLSILVTISCAGFYEYEITSDEARASWSPLQLALGVAVPAVAWVLVVSWRCSRNVQTHSIKTLVRTGLCIATTVFLSGVLLASSWGFINMFVATCGLALLAALMVASAARERNIR
jgi:hypothetical protein